jgi:hypothetical protein
LRAGRDDAYQPKSVSFPGHRCHQRYALIGFDFALYLSGPISLAHAILRHRVFDLGVIFRWGLQYALARRVLVSAVPVLAAIFLADLLIHGDQPILVVFRSRWWMHLILAGFAALAYVRRRNWLDALDGRSFREQYDAQRILREVVEEVRAAKSFEQEATGVVSRIEAARDPATPIGLVATATSA